MLKFNIVYTPGTISYLHLLALSFSKWSDCSFRLVTNGCSAKKTAWLREFCSQYDRLEFLVLPTQETAPHGEALSYLQTLEQSDHFCFMDSDVLTTADSLRASLPHLDGCAACFSGSPIYSSAEDQILPAAFQRMVGRHTYSDQGLCLGNSFFAIYDNRILNEVIRSTGIDFRRRLWSDVSHNVQEQIAALNLRKQSYDTGKSLNLLLIARGEELLYEETPTLQHLGGISLMIRRSQKRWPFNVRGIARRLPGPARPWLLNKLGPPNWAGDDSNIAQAEIMDSVAWRKKKRKCSRYFTSLLRALFAEQALPSAPRFEDPFDL